MSSKKNKHGMTKIQQIFIPSNWPGNMLTMVNNCDWPSRILRTMWLVLDSRPGPNITILGVFFGHNDLSMSESRWKLACFCFKSFATSGQHCKYLQQQSVPLTMLYSSGLILFYSKVLIIYIFYRWRGLEVGITYFSSSHFSSIVTSN